MLGPSSRLKKTNTTSHTTTRTQLLLRDLLGLLKHVLLLGHNRPKLLHQHLAAAKEPFRCQHRVFRDILRLRTRSSILASHQVNSCPNTIREASVIVTRSTKIQVPTCRPSSVLVSTSCRSGTLMWSLPFYLYFAFDSTFYWSSLTSCLELCNGY